jgi:hypothetical protein
MNLDTATNADVEQPEREPRYRQRRNCMGTSRPDDSHSPAGRPDPDETPRAPDGAVERECENCGDVCCSGESYRTADDTRLCPDCSPNDTLAIEIANLKADAVLRTQRMLKLAAKLNRLADENTQVAARVAKLQWFLRWVHTWAHAISPGRLQERIDEVLG